MSPIIINTQFIQVENLVKKLVDMSTDYESAREIALDIDIILDSIIADMCCKNSDKEQALNEE